MQAMHVYSSLPRGTGVPMMNYEIRLLCLSAIAYQMANGKKPILVTDSRLKTALKDKDLTTLWDHVDTDRLQGLEAKFSRFKAAGKMYLLKQLKESALLIDVDAVLFEKVPSEIKNLALCAAHLEIDPDHKFYPRASEVAGLKHFPAQELAVIDKSPILNTSLLWVNELSFLEEWCSLYFEILERDDGAIPPKELMTFAEQRMAGYLAKNRSLEISVFRNAPWSCSSGKFLEETPGSLIQDFHHLWHQKINLQKVPQLEASYFEKLLSVIEMKLPGVSGEFHRRFEE